MIRCLSPATWLRSSSRAADGEREPVLRSWGFIVLHDSYRYHFRSGTGG
jgi:hypothetical protein